MGKEKNGKIEPHYYSNRLKRKLDKLRFASITIVEAPSGYGKTTAIKDYLEDSIPLGTPIYWFTAMDEVPASGFRRLYREIVKIDRNAGEQLLKLGIPNASNIGEIVTTLRSIRCIYETYLVIDDFQFLYNVLLYEFFIALLEHGGKGLHIIIITQMLKRNLLATIKGHGVLYIGIADLQLNTEDICSYYALAGVNINYKDAQKVASNTEGWIIAVYLQLLAFKETGKLTDMVGILELMEHLVWDMLTEEQKKFLLYLSPFEMVTMQQACNIIGYNSFPEYALDVLECPFIHYESAKGWYELHNILTRLLIRKRKEYGEVFERECLKRAGDYCRDEGKISEALGFYTQIKDYDRMLSLDISDMASATIDNIPFAELAKDIVCNCPAEIKRKYILSMLRIAWALYMNGLKDEYEKLMTELYQMPELQNNENLENVNNFVL